MSVSGDLPEMSVQAVAALTVSHLIDSDRV
jgi:hypothetical protein